MAARGQPLVVRVILEGDATVEIKPGKGATPPWHVNPASVKEFIKTTLQQVADRAEEEHGVKFRFVITRVNSEWKE